MAALLDIRGLSARHGQVEALKRVDLAVSRGEFVLVLGPNGAGKSTLLSAIMGLIPGSGAIRFGDAAVERLSTRARAQRGMIMVPESRGIFGPLSVWENLELGAYLARDHGEVAARRAKVYELFPRLRERESQAAGSLSGGEQQMLAIGRGLMANPTLLMLDEPSLGLAPRIAAEILETLGELNRSGLTILLVEQKAPLALKLAQRAYVLSLGRIAAERTPDQLSSAHDLARFYLA
ncbi:MAG TPA: ABC transporter ATP-binding protein [Stellaceae bacterium]|nr:ABC transporter ATP-binding protein [Stellaceae bacterium]